MVQQNFTGVCINTLNTLRYIISTFPKNSGSVSVVNRNRIHTQWGQWRSQLPQVYPYYAVKSNPNPILLDVLSSHNVNFDCASLREVHDVKEHTIAHNRISPEISPHIIYAHPLKSEFDIHTINSLNIQTTVIDSVEECDKLKKCGWKGDALLRVAVSDSESKMPFSIKFGATKEEVSLIAKSSKIPISGISFHVGSGCQNPDQYLEAIQYSYESVYNILIKNGHSPKVIDIGGGFSADSKTFQITSSVISKAIKKVPASIKIIAEPGRYFAQPTEDLFVKVIAKKPGKNGWRYVIDESLYGYFSCIPFDHQTPAWFRVPTSKEDRVREKTNAILFGRTCDSLDVIMKGEMETLEIGDWLYFPLMGAYTNVTASEFNGFPKPYLIEDIQNCLPTTQQAYSMLETFHSSHSVKYSNSLTPIV